MYRLACVTCLFVIATWTVGCTPKNDPAPPTAPVKGTVTLDGQPMTEGEVRFAVKGYPSRPFEIKNGAFSGDAFIGQNNIEVTLDKDAPNPMDQIGRASCRERV